METKNAEIPARFAVGRKSFPLQAASAGLASVPTYKPDQPKPAPPSVAIGRKSVSTATIAVGRKSVSSFPQASALGAPRAEAKSSLPSEARAASSPSSDFGSAKPALGDASASSAGSSASVEGKAEKNAPSSSGSGSGLLSSVSNASVAAAAQPSSSAAAAASASSADSLAWSNEINSERLPNLTVVHRLVHSDGVKAQIDGALVASCTCSGRCGLTCPCRRDSTTTYRTNRQQTLGRVQGEQLTECNAGCSCSADCGNRVVSNTDQAVAVEIFRTKDKGWGVRAKGDIAQGRYISEYCGELLTEDEVQERLDSKTRKQLKQENAASYLWTIHDFTIDAWRCGNASRFVNHSCEPNVVALQVFIESRSPSMAHIGFFAKSTIRRGEELTLDYHLPKLADTNVPCLCGSSKCRGWLC